MSWMSILVLLVLVVGGLIGLASVLCRVDPFSITVEEARARVRGLRPYLAVLGSVYLLNRLSHTTGQRLSARIGTDITWLLYAIEGKLVADLQAIVPYGLTGYFSFVYLFGFSFMLVFPAIAYFLLPEQRYLKELVVAYTVNYGVGTLCYVAFIAYGPRKVIAAVREPMFEQYPQVIAFTASVNSSANVFPSLHVSFAVTAVLLAWRTRSAYPRWPWLATVVTANIAVATMFLGIHWLLDVVAGIGLAIASVGVALTVVGRLSGSDADISTVD